MQDSGLKYLLNPNIKIENGDTTSDDDLNFVYKEVLWIYSVISGASAPFSNNVSQIFYPESNY